MPRPQPAQRALHGDHVIRPPRCPTRVGQAPAEPRCRTGLTPGAARGPEVSPVQVESVAQLAQELSPEELSVAFDQVAGIGGLVDATFVGQVDQEIETLQQVTGRTHSAVEMTTLRDTLYRSLRTIIAGVALTDPSFAKVALELSKEGAAKLGIV